jgi:hypothetical protein
LRAEPSKIALATAIEKGRAESTRAAWGNGRATRRIGRSFRSGNAAASSGGASAAEERRRRRVSGTMFLYNLTLQKGGGINRAVVGNFSAPKAHEIVVARNKTFGASASR